MTAEARVRLTLADSGSEIPVRALSLDRVLSHPVGRAELEIPAGVTPPDAGASLGLSAEVEGTEVTLMSGEAAQVVKSASGARVTMLEPIARLNRHAPSSAWTGDTAGGVIGALCRDADVPTATILPGITIPHMVLGHWASLLDHAIRLARMSGMALVSAVDGAVSTLSLALPIPTGPIDTNRAASELGDVSLSGEPEDARVSGAGAMGSNGPGMTTLPLQDASLITSGSDDAGRQFTRAGIRMLTDAATAQLAAAQRLAAPLSGLKLTTPLPENLSPGDVVLAPDANGIPTRIVRVERLGVTLSGRTGILANYAFSDVRVA